MSEVPEHLLKRSAEARARMTGEAPADAGGDGGEEAAPAPAASTAPVPAASAPVPEVPAEPEPVAPYVEAAMARRRMPVWIIPVLLFLPLWAIYYVGYLERPGGEPEGLLFEGGEIYAAQCASCHGAGGGGGSGRQLNGGEVLLTFPAEGGYDGLAGHMAWVINGTDGTRANEGSAYGSPDHPDGQRQTGGFGNMSGFANLNIEELSAVVYYERVTHGQLDAETAETELRVLEEFIEHREEEGITEWAGETVADLSTELDLARAAVGGGGEAAAG